MSSPEVVSAVSAKKAARIFHIGNIIAVLIPFPLFILWFGASMFVYAMLRHHPNPRVGYYTQLGAYYYYGLAGLSIPVLTFAPKGFFQHYGWWLWGAALLMMLPLSLYQLWRIQQEHWQDTDVKQEAR